jgi:Domain of unknown function (DUF4383)
MNQTIAKLFGWVFILVGVLGFFGFAGGTMSMGTPGNLLGLFPVNLLHNVVHILIGLWGLNAARTPEGATAYCKQAGVLYLLLAILGFIPATATMLANLVPIGGNDVYLHLVLAVILCYFGFAGNSRHASTA